MGSRREVRSECGKILIPLVSFNVESLFTKITIEGTLNIIDRIIKPIDYVLNTTQHCISTTYFKFEDNIYKQMDGASMGSPLSPVLAN